MSKHLDQATLDRMQRHYDDKLPTMRTACLALGLKQVVAQFSGRSDDITIDAMFGITFNDPEHNTNIVDYPEDTYDQPEHRMHQAIWKQMLETIHALYPDTDNPTYVNGQIVYELSTGKCLEPTFTDPWMLQDDDLPF